MATQALDVENVIPINPFYNVTNVNVDITEQTAVTGVVTDSPRNMAKSQTLKATFKWDQGGLLVTWGVALPFNFSCEIFMEKLGTGNDQNFPATVAPVPYDATLTTYTHDLLINGSALETGAYRLIASFKLGNNATPGQSQLAGFTDLGIINVYQD